MDMEYSNITYIRTLSVCLRGSTVPPSRLFRYQRSEESLKDYGQNSCLVWRNDGSGIAVVTDTGCVILFSVNHNPQQPLSYQCVEHKSGVVLNDAIGCVEARTIDAEAVVDAGEEVVTINAVDNDHIFLSTKSGYLKQFHWDEGCILEEFSCSIGEILFTDPNQHSYRPPDDVTITSMAYSQALVIAAVSFSNGHAAYLASSDDFKPGSVHALLAPSISNAICSSINPRHHLIVFGCENGDVIVYVLNYDNGLLNFSHKLEPSPNENLEEVPEPSRVVQLMWSPDGCCIAVVYASGLLRVWSVFGIFLYSCSNNVTQCCWDPEGYNLWVISGIQTIKIPFMKSPLTVNNVTNNQNHILLQSASQIYILPNQFPSKTDSSIYGSIYQQEKQATGTPSESFLSTLGSPLENWPWQVIQIPELYANANAPIRYAAIGASGVCTAVAGRCGFAFYISAKHKWRCFGNEAQEQSFVVRGGMLWWKGVLVVACWHPQNNKNSIYMYPHHTSIDYSSVVDTIPMASPIITINNYGDYLAVLTATNRVSLYLLHLEISPSLNVTMSHQKMFDFSIAKYTPQPCAVLSVHISPLTTDSKIPNQDIKSVIINIAGKLLMFEINDMGDVSLPVTIATNVECVSCPSAAGEYLAATLWLNCGARGLRVWLPLHRSDDGDYVGRRRILLPVEHNVYPLVIHHREAAVLGIPFDMLKCRSETFLHILLHQLVTQNLGKHAYAIATQCHQLPYFHHTLELMIHKALESDMNKNSNMLDNPVFPDIVNFMKLLPHYLSAIAHCARKTEMMQWSYIFKYTGNVQNLLDQCLATESLDTAILYLVILQNLEPLSVSRVYIVKLLEASIQQKRWDLGVDLLRFLHAISYENEGLPKRKLTGTSDLVIRLRRSSESFDDETPLSPATPGFETAQYEELAFPPAQAELSDKKIAKRIISHHAHQLLVSCQFRSLGEMSYYLNFDLAQFLDQERANLSEIVDPVHVFMSLHEEFSWPFPDVIPRILDHPHVSSNLSVVSLSCDTHPDTKPNFVSLESVRTNGDDVDTTDSASLYDESVYSECRVEIDPDILARALKRGTPESESQLQFFLKLFVTARVYNYALLFALALRDVDQITQVVSCDPSAGILSFLVALEAWGNEESGGYCLFLQSLKPRLAPLFPSDVNDVRLQPVVKISSTSSLTSLGTGDAGQVPAARRPNLIVPGAPPSNMRVSPDVIQTSSSNASCSIS